VDWREYLQKAVSENPYAKYAKVSAPNEVLQVLHIEPDDHQNRHPPCPPARKNPALQQAVELAEPISWFRWKANALNLLFQEQGITGEPGRITASAVAHGERRTATRTLK
jgi:hypothetical protein